MIPLTGYRRTLSGLVSDTQRLLNDWHGEKYDPARVIQAINDVAVDICEGQRLCCESVDVRCFEGVLGYDVFALVEGKRSAGESIRSFAGIERVKFDGSEIVPSGSVSEFFTGKGFQWSSDLVSWGCLMLFLPPAVTGDASGDGKNLTVTYFGYPEPMVLGTDSPDAALPMCDDALCYGAASMLLMEGDMDDFKTALAYDGLYRREIGRLKMGVSKMGVFDDMRPL